MGSEYTRKLSAGVGFDHELQKVPWTNAGFPQNWLLGGVLGVKKVLQTGEIINLAIVNYEDLGHPLAWKCELEVHNGDIRLKIQAFGNSERVMRGHMRKRVFGNLKPTRELMETLLYLTGH